MAEKTPHPLLGTAGVHTELLGNKKMIMDGCDGIVDYSDDEVILRGGRLKLTVVGRDLRLRVLTNSAAVVEGYISGIQFGYF